MEGLERLHPCIFRTKGCIQAGPRGSHVVQLHGHLSSGNAYKPWLLLTLLGRSFDHVPTGFFEETKTKEFRALNPNGKVPVLVDGDFVLAESNAILCYLAEGTPWMPTEPRAKALVMQWLFFEQYSHEPYVSTMRAILHFQDPSPERDALVESKRASAEHALAVMDAHVADRDWFVGGGPTVADLALFPYTATAEEGTLDLGPFPNILSWLGRVRALPGFVAQPPFSYP